MDAERLQNIEEGLRQQVAANRSTQEMLARLFDKFNNLELPNLTVSQPIIAPPNLQLFAVLKARIRISFFIQKLYLTFRITLTGSISV
jgi:hypothetical protein